MIDDKDKVILGALKEDSRKNTKSIAEELLLPRITVHERIKRMMERGIIKKFTALEDYKQTGLPITAFIFLSFDQTDKEISQRDLARKIGNLPGVFEVHIMAGEWDLLIKVRAGSVEEISKMIIDKMRVMGGVGKTVTAMCFETVKEEP
ncbi:MAG: Lrp/AsnC family transcriptional regulator [Candidatus Thermoplasmatota archaeon]|nr:Lrp/AsnC family transcriptional regulator [Candidatus Thermoplasmatota archaeon]